MKIKNTKIHLTAIILLLTFPPFYGCKNKNRIVTEPTPIAEQKDSTRKITIIFGGDVMQHMPQVTAAYRDSVYDYESSFAYLKPIFENADLSIVNLEGTLSEKGPYSGYPRFRAPASLAGTLKRCGVNAVMLANNHICDKGNDGILSTVTAIKNAGLLYTGAFADSASYNEKNPLYITANGFRLAILNYTYGTNGLPVPAGMIVNTMDTVIMAQDFRCIEKDGADLIIAFLHWGNEYSRLPDTKQKKMAEWCRSKGADIIIGSHPHVIQPVTTERDTNGNIVSVTAFSLGNLVSNQRWRYSNGGLLLETEITADGVNPKKMEVSYMPVWVYKHYRNGRREYEILPPSAADTLLDNDRAAREKYDEFMEDTQKLLLSGTTERK